MKENIKNKFKEALSAILPISIAVAILCFGIAPVSIDVFILFIVGAIMLVAGIALFTLGAEMSMTVIGERIGAYISTHKKIFVSILLIVIIGIIVIMSEPDLSVYANQIHEIPSLLLVLTVAIGSGLLLAIAFFRIKFGMKLKYILMILYAIVFLLVIFCPKEFWAVAFDSGGVTTGAVSVPFIVAIGAGAAAMRSDKNAENDSFGLLAICSVGPVLAVLILGLFYNVTEVSYNLDFVHEIGSSKELWELFSSKIPIYMKEVAMSLLPILILFILFRLFAFKVSKKEMYKIIVGAFYVYVGLVLFSTGTKVGFMPAGSFIGEAVASAPNNWIIIPIGMILGYFMVKAEPAVVVLVRQISDITDGAIPEKLMMFSQEIGIALAIGLSMLRIITGVSILWILIPCYVLAFILSFFTPEIFTAIAFDSGGVASGTMTAVFLIPFSIGVCNIVGGDVLTDAFGIVAVAAAIPVVCIQLVGLLYKYKLRDRKEIFDVHGKEEIIEIDWMWESE